MCVCVCAHVFIYAKFLFFILFAAYVLRGVKARSIDEAKLRKFGGVERSPMSTSKDRKIAESYAGVSASSHEVFLHHLSYRIKNLE